MTPRPEDGRPAGDPTAVGLEGAPIRTLVLDPGTLTPVPQGPPPPAPSPSEPAPSGRSPGLRGEFAVLLGALVVFAWSFWSPSPWWDEAISRFVVSRSYGGGFELVTGLDLVHYAYYVLGHTLFLLAGSPEGSETVYVLLRLVSVVAAALTAVVLIRIGKTLGTPAAGYVAALAFIASPLASRYAQEARPYALVTLAAAVSTLILARLLLSSPRHWTPQDWLGYTLSLVVTGLLNLVALLVLVPHLAMVLLVRPRGGRRRRWLPATLALVAAMGALGPLMVASLGQSGQVSWLVAPDGAALYQVFDTQWEQPEAVLGLVVLAVVLGLWHLSRRPGHHLAAARTHEARVRAARLREPDASEADHRPTPAEATLAAGPAVVALVGAIWGVVPTLLLWGLSQEHPLFVPRYLVFTLPGLCLVIGALAAMTRVWAGLAAVALLAAGGLGAQAAQRDPATGHAENIRGIADQIAARAEPGDAVFYLPYGWRVVERGYPDRLDTLADIAAAPARAPRDLVYGAEINDLEELRRRAAGHERIWVVTGEPRLGDRYSRLDREKFLITACRDRVSHWASRPFVLDLYVVSDTPRDGC